MRVIWVALLVVTVVSGAAYSERPVTPGVASALLVRPYDQWEEWDEDSFFDACRAMKYVSVTRRGDGNRYLMTSYFVDLGGPRGLVCVVTHGTPTGHDIEVYDSLAARDAAYDLYVQNGWGLWIYRSEFPDRDLYAIGAWHTGVNQFFTSFNTAVVNKSCGSSAYASSWRGALLHVGSNNPAGVPPLSTLFSSLGAFETFQTAASNHSLWSLTGNGDVVLAPRLLAQPEGCSSVSSEGKTLKWEFNCLMSRAGYATVSSGPLVLCGAQWVNGWTYEACARSVGSGRAGVDGDFLSSNGVPFVHPTRHWEFGCLDAGETERVVVSGGAATWESERGNPAILRYAVYGYRGDCPARLGECEATGAGQYRVPVPMDYETYQLVAEEKDRVRVLARIGPVTTAAEVPRHWTSDLPADIKRALWSAPATGLGREKSGAADTVVVFTTADLLPVLQAQYQPLRAAQGWLVVLVVTDDGAGKGSPAVVREGIKSQVATWVSAGVRDFLLVGDANDYVEFQAPWPGLWAALKNDYIAAGYPAGGQPDRNKIPTWYRWVPPDSDPDQYMEYFIPYLYSDQGYIDHDGDQIPDPGLTIGRIPVATAGELSAYLTKMALYENALSQTWGHGPVRAGMLVGNDDHHGVATGLAYVDMAADITAYAVSGGSVFTHYETDAPTQGLLNQALESWWNTEAWNLIAIPAAWSTRYKPGFFMDVTSSEHPFNVEALHDGVALNGGLFPLVLACTCNVEDFARTELPTYGRPVIERLMVHPSKGIIGSLGPTVGTRKSGNHLLGRELLKEVAAVDGNLVARRVFARLRQIMLSEDPSSEIFRMAQSTVLLMDVCQRFPWQVSPTGVEDWEEPGAEEAASAQVRVSPNPGNAGVVFSFQCRESVDVAVRIYDLRGRLIWRFQGSDLQGVQEIRWRGVDMRGSKVSSGTYIYKIQQGRLLQSGKVSLVM